VVRRKDTDTTVQLRLGQGSLGLTGVKEGTGQKALAKT
jgi:hypothetical protein